MILAVFIVLFTYTVALMHPDIRSDSRLRSCFLLALTCHHILAWVNAEMMVLPGAEGDSMLFFEAASAPAGSYNYDTMLYTHFLRYMFGLFGSSLFLAGELSVLAYTGICLLMISLLDMLGCKHRAAGAILLFGCLPSILVHFSIPLRESFQSLALACICVSACRLRYTMSLPWMGGLVLGLLGLGASHNHLSTMALGIAALSGLLIARKFAGGFAIFLMLFFVPLFYGVSFDSDILDSANSGFESVRVYREGVMDAGGRAMYGSQVETDSPIAFILSVPKLFLLYMTAPWPWQVGSLADILALSENVLRLILLFIGIKIWLGSASGIHKEFRQYLIGMFLFVELVWSLGTGNWGTAYRHHTVTIFLLPIIAARMSGSAQGVTPSQKTQGEPSLREQIRRRRRAAAQKAQTAGSIS